MAVVDEETYKCDDEGDPHEEVEPSKDVVERLEPVFGGRRANDVFTVF